MTPLIFPKGISAADILREFGLRGRMSSMHQYLQWQHCVAFVKYNHAQELTFAMPLPTPMTHGDSLQLWNVLQSMATDFHIWKRHACAEQSTERSQTEQIYASFFANSLDRSPLPCFCCQDMSQAVKDRIVKNNVDTQKRCEIWRTGTLSHG